MQAMTVAQRISEAMELEGRPLNARQLYVALRRHFPEDCPTMGVMQVTICRALKQGRLEIISHKGCYYFYYKRKWNIDSSDYPYVFDELAQNYIKKAS